MMELVLKTIIGPIVVGVVLRIVDKWGSIIFVVGKSTIDIMELIFV